MMNAHTNQEFEVFLSQLKETNATLDFFCDFTKIKDNVERVAIKLNQLNYLIGQCDIEAAVHRLWNENPNVFQVLDILIAVRKGDRKKVIDENGELQLIEHFFNSPEGVLTYIKETGLQELFQTKSVSNLVDYVFGVEVGLDTNARKNRSGHLMEHRVSSVFLKNGIDFKQEVCSTAYPELAILGKDKKRFDFVVSTTSVTYLIEVNFYSGGGSKLNEVARAYSELAPKINSLDNFEFVWITDGQGWLTAKNKLQEAFYTIPKIYNLTTICNFVQTIKETL